MMRRYFIRIIAALLLSYFVIMTVSAVFGASLDRDSMLDVWVAVLESLPFGKVFGMISIRIFTEALGMGRDMSAYILRLNNFGPIDFLNDLCKIILTGALIEAVGFFLQALTGVSEGGGITKITMRGIIGVVSAFLCTGIAALVLSHLENSLISFPDAVQGAIKFIVFLISIAGTVGIFYFTLGCSIAGALVMGLVKNLLVNVIKVAATYIGVLLILLYISEGEYLKILPVIGGWGVVIIMMIGVDLMLESIFKEG